MSALEFTQDEIKKREAVLTPLDPSQRYDAEAWLCSYETDAYEDQLGIRHNAWVVWDRQIIHVTHSFEQYEYYGREFFNSGRFGRSDDEREWRYHANLVDYTGGGSWEVTRGDDGLGNGRIWRKAPYTTPDLPVRGYMLPNGMRASKLIPGGNR
jgi:hypothetical protein